MSADNYATVQYQLRGTATTVVGTPLGVQYLDNHRFGAGAQWFLVLEDKDNSLLRRVPLDAVVWFQNGVVEGDEKPKDPDEADELRSRMLRRYRDQLGLSNQSLTDTLNRLSEHDISAASVRAWMAKRGGHNARRCPQWSLDVLEKNFGDRLTQDSAAKTPRKTNRKT